MFFDGWKPLLRTTVIGLCAYAGLIAMLRLSGLLALGLLVGLQFAFTWTSVRVGVVRTIVTGEPTLLAQRGEILQGAMRRERVSEEELQAALRAAGLRSPQEAEAVVFQTDGSFSVVRRSAPTTPRPEDS